MENSDTDEKREHEAIQNSMQNMSIISSSDSHISSDHHDKQIREVEQQPHEALFLVLAYLPLYELLVMSEVCMALREAVSKDVLPWLNIIVQKPLSSRVSDEILMKITSKSNGRLTTLALIRCVQITDDGLRRVIQKNPFIDKLLIPGCTSLTPEGITRAVETLSQQNHTLKTLHINGIYNISKHHLETLESRLKPNPPMHENHQQNQKRPFLYHQYRNSPLNKEVDRNIDVEICPRCDEVRLVYDCSRAVCKRIRKASFRADCRGCDICIPRCVECGGCVESEDMELAVCFDVLCSDCWLLLPKCNFCNRPYCKQHTNLQSSPPGPGSTSGFVCDVCHAKFIRNVYSDDE
ncbi:hypothetical protein JRO89_XS05G0221800 [Xanthoceras sorbifolium]|uniref:F-box domain-containing protein n=1 Tax=Xanthoceras sorbifolium TaxID=99658 RepID=A0ABQ8I374_9ROSI|nr:hypothetical protein JRO89_XS05G0221800 [Xanthoceras sorbifolium]